MHVDVDNSMTTYTIITTKQTGSQTGRISVCVNISSVKYSGKEVSVHSHSQPISVEAPPLRSKALGACVNRAHVASKHPGSISLVISLSSP